MTESAKNRATALAALGLLLLAFVASFPGVLGLAKSLPLTGISASGGHLLSAPMPKGIANQEKRLWMCPDQPTVLEDGKPLERPNAQTKEITNAGRGRFRLRAAEIQFSTSDAMPPGSRRYEVRAPLWSLKEPLLLAIWTAALLACAVAAGRVPAAWIAGLQDSPAASLALATLSAGSLAWLWFFGAPLSDALFEGIAAPFLWAVLMAWSTSQRSAIGRLATLALALVPALAGYVAYALAAKSDGSFLVGGVLPWSDARMHFLQSAGIALDGRTDIFFNGRFLYPAFHAGLLVLVGGNVQAANLVVSALVMVALALAAPLVNRRVGFVGTALFCLLFWLYFRVHGCGLLMTENLGVLMGLLGLAFLLLGAGNGSLAHLLLAVAFFGLGSVARPGALFVLPALVVFLGLRFWDAKRPLRFALAVALATVVLAACFGSNQLFVKTFYSGEGSSFGNFAYTLHGLLNGTNWSTSYEATNGNAKLVMEENIAQIKASPLRLLEGVRRAYGETLAGGFLFRFGGEKRLGFPGLLLFALGALSAPFWRRLRGDSAWMLLVFAGITASIPFAPPWDAEVRPYAATVPLQNFLAAAGMAFALACLGRAAHKLDAAIFGPSSKSVTESGPAPLVAIPCRGLSVLAALALALVLALPLFLKWTGLAHSDPADRKMFRPGSSLVVSSTGGVSHDDFLDRLSPFQARSPEAARAFLDAKTDVLLAINWRNFRYMLLPFPVPEPLPELMDAGGVMVSAPETSR